MEKVDQALKSLQEIRNDFKSFCDQNLHVTEADTRINLIDRILNEVLFWPRQEIRREVHADTGYMDYALKINGKEFVCLEAKKEGESFDSPKDKKRKYYTLNGAITKFTPVYDAILQVRKYCDDYGIRHAIATNGNTWIIFRAIREDKPWREGDLRLFSNLDDIIENFGEFWNLLCYQRISDGSLDSEFSFTTASNREYFRVLNFLLQPDVPLLRNTLHTELHPIITHFFEDIADPNYIETLENCYVYTTTIKTVSNDINFVIKDTVPQFLVNEGTKDIIHGRDDAGIFGQVIERAMGTERGQLFLLLGGIGSGKTTFQKRYQLTVGKDVLNDYSIWFHIDFLKPPINIAELEGFVWITILNQLREKYVSPYLETRQNIKRAYKLEIEALKETALYTLKEGTPEYEKALTPFLTEWQSNLSEYVPKLLSIARERKNFNVVLFVDNVDQLSPEYQAQIFLLAQRVTDKTKSITIIALREESYYTASVQRVFNAYINRKFHIASPPFRKMIGHRINYAITIIDSKNQVTEKFKSFQELANKKNISDFLKIVEHSIFERNRNIARFIDHLCFGNMRNALQMFSTFLVSGATDVNKMLKIFRRDGNYYVAFHEFLKSIMLGERYYYRDSYSSILNIFECGQEKNAGHFTSLRILSVLNFHKTEYSKEGEGFFEISKLYSLFEDNFNNKEDFVKSLNRMVNRKLIETNTKIFENIQGSTHVRINSSGWYYYRYLVRSFAYLDLVFQDTPINDKETVQKLVESINKVNNLSDPEEDKTSRLEERFNRVEIFLDYLEKEELSERKKYQLDGKSEQGGPIFAPFIKEIRESFLLNKDYILRRIKFNKERYEEEMGVSFDEEFLTMPTELEEDENLNAPELPFK